MGISRYIKITMNDAKNNKYPCCVKDREGKLWVFYQSFIEKGGNKGDYIFGSCFDGEEWLDEIRISTGGLAYRPCCTIDSNGFIWVAWSEGEGDGFNIFVSIYWSGKWSDPIRITDSGRDFHPSIAADKEGNVTVAWCRCTGANPEIVFKTGSLDDTTGRITWNDERRVAGRDENYRPSIAYDNNGKLWIAFDAFDIDEKKYDVYLAGYEDGEYRSITKLSDTVPELWNARPCIACDASNNIHAAWEGHGNNAYVAYYAAKVVNGEKQKAERVFSKRSDTHSLSIYIDDSGRLWLAYNADRRTVCAQYCDGTAWSEPRILGHITGTSRRPVICQDREGDYWFIAQGTNLRVGNTNQRNAYLYARYLKKDRFNDFKELKVYDLNRSLSKTGNEEFENRIVPEGSSRKSSGFKHNGYRLCWGDIHTHSELSDGNKTIDMLYNYQKYVAGMDFGAVTDHTEFPDKLTDSEFHLTRFYNRIFDREDFKTVLAFEWTSNEWIWNYGHKNVYFGSSDVPIMRTCDRNYNNPDKLFNSVSKYGGVVPCHHPSGRFITLEGYLQSAFNDWSYHDEEVETVVEICSHWGVFEFDGNEGSMEYEISHNHVQDALAMGYHLGFVGGSDTHAGMPGMEKGITGVFVKTLSSKDIVEAMRMRRTIASQGPRVHIDFSLNDFPGGSILNNIRDRHIRIFVKAPDFECNIRKIVLVKNNIDIKSFDINDKTGVLEYNDSQEGQNDYYYVRVIMENGDRAWASPIWVSSGSVC